MGRGTDQILQRRDRDHGRYQPQPRGAVSKSAEYVRDSTPESRAQLPRPTLPLGEGRGEGLRRDLLVVEHPLTLSLGEREQGRVATQPFAAPERTSTRAAQRA